MTKRIAAFIFSTLAPPSFIATTWEAAKEVSYTVPPPENRPPFPLRL